MHRKSKIKNRKIFALLNFTVMKNPDDSFEIRVVLKTQLLYNVESLCTTYNITLSTQKDDYYQGCGKKGILVLS